MAPIRQPANRVLRTFTHTTHLTAPAGTHVGDSDWCRAGVIPQNVGPSSPDEVCSPIYLRNDSERHKHGATESRFSCAVTVGCPIYHRSCTGPTQNMFQVKASQCQRLEPPEPGPPPWFFCLTCRKRQQARKPSLQVWSTRERRQEIQHNYLKKNPPKPPYGAQRCRGQQLHESSSRHCSNPRGGSPFH